MKQNPMRDFFRRCAAAFHGFASDRSGNVMMIFGLSMVPLFLFVGAALDYTRALDARTKMQAVADLATIAATKELLKDGVTEAQAVALAEGIFNAQINSNPQAYGTLTNIKPNVVATKSTIDGNVTSRVVVDATADIDLVLVSTFGNHKLFDVGVRSVSENTAESLGALSMFFVLDRSGSMDDDDKMVSLKKASADLLAQLAKADPDKKYVRTGAAAYNTEVESFEPLKWGTAHVNAYTQALVPDGGTNTSVGAKIAFKALKHKREAKLHKEKNKQDPKKFMLLLTDGKNNQISWDTDTLKFCNKAKNKGMKVYTIAFQAESDGEKLLKKCASSPQDYYDASRADELIAAFRAIGNEVSRTIPRVTH